MQSPFMIPFIMIAFLMAFPLFWIAIVFFISFVSGWQGLSSRYATKMPAPPRAKSLAYGMVGISRYNGVLTIGLTEQGMYLSVFILFRPGHKPLFIPWSEISEVKKIDYFFRKMYNIKVGSPTITTLKLPITYFKGWESYLEKRL